MSEHDKNDERNDAADETKGNGKPSKPSNEGGLRNKAFIIALFSIGSAAGNGVLSIFAISLPVGRLPARRNSTYVLFSARYLP